MLRLWNRFWAWIRSGGPFSSIGGIAGSIAYFSAVVIVLGHMTEYDLLTPPFRPFVPLVDTLLKDFYSNLGTELFSIALTVWIVDGFNQRQVKADYILDMGSRDNSIAVNAARKMKRRSWGFNQDRSLERADLDEANLENAKLFHINLQKSYMIGANLNGAQLHGANLSEAIMEEITMSYADLTNAKLKAAKLSSAKLISTRFFEANLENSVLEFTNLESADFYGANLSGANLKGANLKKASLAGTNLVGANMLHVVNIELAYFDEGTTMPNGIQWHRDFDFSSFEPADEYSHPF